MASVVLIPKPPRPWLECPRRRHPARACKLTSSKGRIPAPMDQWGPSGFGFARTCRTTSSQLRTFASHPPVPTSQPRQPRVGRWPRCRPHGGHGGESEAEAPSAGSDRQLLRVLTWLRKGQNWGLASRCLARALAGVGHAHFLLQQRRSRRSGIYFAIVPVTMAVASRQLPLPPRAETELCSGRPLPWIAGPVLHDAEPAKNPGAPLGGSSGRTSPIIAKQLNDSDYGILKVGGP